jgi:hypothetical protein
MTRRTDREPRVRRSCERCRYVFRLVETRNIADQALVLVKRRLNAPQKSLGALIAILLIHLASTCRETM